MIFSYCLHTIISSITVEYRSTKTLKALKIKTYQTQPTKPIIKTYCVLILWLSTVIFAPTHRYR